MMNADKRVEEKSCNCKNSKCMKLYCDCFSARVPCGKTCRCVGCQNTTLREAYQDKLYAERRLSREELIRMHKGCACRRSNCTKKYCDCFQSGILCKETCKCVDCQNNESLTNRKVIEELRNRNSELSQNQSSINLYSLYISQNSDHLRSIIADSNPLSLQDNWLDHCARLLIQESLSNDPAAVLDKFLHILIQLENEMGDQIKFKDEFSEGMDEEPSPHHPKSTKKEKMHDNYGSQDLQEDDMEDENDEDDLEEEQELKEEQPQQEPIQAIKQESQKEQKEEGQGDV